MSQPEHLEPPEAARFDLPWAEVALSVLNFGARRLEASSYLTDGYGQRQLIESKPSGWVALREVADIWQPSRLKGVVVKQGAGLPFLSAGQVFEAAPTVRKWLAKTRIPHEDTRYVRDDWLLLSRSGDVGRVTAVYPPVKDVIITDDLLRIVPRTSAQFGWLYAYLRTQTFREIARTSQYGHMIKHLEPEHVQAMPIVDPGPGVTRKISQLVRDLLRKRRKALAMTKEAEDAYQMLVAPNGLQLDHEFVSSVSTTELINARRRLDASFATPAVRSVEKIIRDATKHGLMTVEAVTESVNVGSRFKRHFGDNGTPYRSAGELFDLNAPITKRIFPALVDRPERYVLRTGWIVMACSGQVYGINGRVMLLGKRHEGMFGSHDLIRIIPNVNKIDTGYLLTALSHPILGRPLVIRNAYGTSIPHLDPMDVRAIEIPRFDPKSEKIIGALARQAADLRDEADSLEDAITGRAEQLVRAFAAAHI